MIEPAITDDKRPKHIDAALLCEPESQWNAANGKRVEFIDKQDSTTKRGRKPYRQRTREQTRVSAPIGRVIQS